MKASAVSCGLSKAGRKLGGGCFCGTVGVLCGPGRKPLDGEMPPEREGLRVSEGQVLGTGAGRGWWKARRDFGREAGAAGGSRGGVGRRHTEPRALPVLVRLLLRAFSGFSANGCKVSGDFTAK